MNGNLRDVSRRGFVYVLEAADGRRCKIGRSTQPLKRIAALRSQSGNSDGRQWVSPEQPDAVALESACHQHLAAARSMGEWFEAAFSIAVEAVQSRVLAAPTEAEIALAAACATRGNFMSIADFCATYQIGRAKFFDMKRKGIAPRDLSRQTIYEWQRACEKRSQPATETATP